MILTCPRCATRYLADDRAVWTTGRTVQCEACGQQWRAVGPGARPERHDPSTHAPQTHAQQTHAPPPEPPKAHAPEPKAAGWQTPEPEPAEPTPPEWAYPRGAHAEAAFAPPTPKDPAPPEPAPEPPPAFGESEAPPGPSTDEAAEPAEPPLPIVFRPLEDVIPPKAPPPPPEEDPAGATLFRSPRPMRPAPSRYGPPGLGASLAILFLLALGVGALAVFRDPIVRAAPGLAPLYGAVGLWPGDRDPARSHG